MRKKKGTVYLYISQSPIKAKYRENEKKKEK